jgi:hypothetical protein
MNRRAGNIVFFDVNQVFEQMMPEMILAFRMGVRDLGRRITLNVTVTAAMLATAVNVDAVANAGRKNGLIGEWAIPLDDAGTCDGKRFFLRSVRQKIECRPESLVFGETFKSRCVLAVKVL